MNTNPIVDAIKTEIEEELKEEFRALATKKAKELSSEFALMANNCIQEKMKNLSIYEDINPAEMEHRIVIKY